MGKVEEAIEVLKELGLPKAQQNERSALTLLALLDLKKSTPWPKAKQQSIRIHDILTFVYKHYNKQYAENTRETIRRQTIHQFEQAGIVNRNPDNPRRPTNSPSTVYAISDDAHKVVRKYKTKNWNSALQEFIRKKGKLVDRYEMRRKKHLISVNLPEGTEVHFSPGKHNKLQAEIIRKFMPRFSPHGVVAYVGDAARKMLHIDEELLKKLEIPLTKHDKLPDVVLYDPKSDRLLLIEAVTAHGPLSPKRQLELEKALKHCKSERIYISAFPDFHEFKKHIENIAWETEVWIENNPDHMVHFNGPKFFTVYTEQNSYRGKGKD